MGIKFILVLIIAILISMLLDCSAQSSCSNHTFSGNRVFDSCMDLPALEAYLHWNYIKPTQKVQIAFRATQTPTGWISWAINPTGTGMVGSQAIVAFLNSNGSLMVYPTPVTSYVPSMEPGTLSFDVSNLTAEYYNNQMTIYAVLGPLNGTTVNHVWQAGSVSDDVPQAHSMYGENTQSLGTMELFSS
uniref:DOMON domain-containing protein n=1 Tax=Kalanchoe fedtschenkoi TaxID=63787 RepID=A0A7N0TUF2_KALFE